MIWKYVYRYRKLYLLGMLFVLCTSVGLLIPKLMGRAVHHLEQEPVPSARYLGYIALLIVGVAFLRGLFFYLSRMTLGPACRYVEYDLRNDIFENHSLLRLSSTLSVSRMRDIWSIQVFRFSSISSGVSIGRVLSFPDGSPTVVV